MSSSVNRSRVMLVASLALNVVLVATLVLAPAIGSRSYQVALAAGLETRLTAEDVARLGLGRIQQMEQRAIANGLDTSTLARILLVSSTPREDIAAIEPRLTGTLDPGGAVWVVRAEGTFISERGKGAPIVARSGYFLFDDATGEPLGMGMP